MADQRTSKKDTSKNGGPVVDKVEEIESRTIIRIKRRRCDDPLLALAIEELPAAKKPTLSAAFSSLSTVDTGIPTIKKASDVKVFTLLGSTTKSDEASIVEELTKQKTQKHQSIKLHPELDPAEVRLSKLRDYAKERKVARFKQVSKIRNIQAEDTNEEFKNLAQLVDLERIDETDAILKKFGITCNNVPMTEKKNETPSTEEAEKDDDYVYDIYVRDQSQVVDYTNVRIEPFDIEFADEYEDKSDYDTEDSNDPEHPWNDYPDEDSSPHTSSDDEHTLWKHCYDDADDVDEDTIDFRGYGKYNNDYDNDDDDDYY